MAIAEPTALAPGQSDTIKLDQQGDVVVWRTNGATLWTVQLEAPGDAWSPGAIVSIQVSNDGLKFYTPPLGAVTLTAWGIATRVDVGGYKFVAAVVTTEGSGSPQAIATGYGTDTSQSLPSSIAHSFLSGLTADDHGQYPLTLGRTGNLTLNGSIDANGDMILHGTSSATRTTSYISMQPTAGSVAIGATTAAGKLDVVGGNLHVGSTADSGREIRLYNSGISLVTAGYAAFTSSNYFGYPVVGAPMFRCTSGVFLFDPLSGLASTVVTGANTQYDIYNATQDYFYLRVRCASGGVQSFSISGAQAYQEATPAQIVANTNNYALANARHFRISSDAARDITGIVAVAVAAAGAYPAYGGRLTLTNIGAFTITLKHDVTSTAANRFICPGAADFLLTAGMTRDIHYDVTSARWRVI